MNSSIYVFGELADNYTQYPDDSARHIFQTLLKYATSPAQIVVYRDGNLMYYSYIRRLDSAAKKIGFCVVMTGESITDLPTMFAAFEQLIESLVEHGYIVGFDKTGLLRPLTKSLYLNKVELEFVGRMLDAAFNSLRKTSRLLPACDMSVPRDKLTEFSIGDNRKSILAACESNGYVIIHKSHNYSTARLNSYIGILAKSHEENTRLENENQDLKKQVLTLERQKKQFRIVAILAAAVAICGIGLLSLYSSLGSARQENTSLQETVKDKDSEISRLDSRHKKDEMRISAMLSQHSNDTVTISRLNSDIKSLKSAIELFENVTPIIITNMEIWNTNSSGAVTSDFDQKIFAFNADYLSPKIEYNAPIHGTQQVALSIRLYGPDSRILVNRQSPSGCSFSKIMTIQPGKNSLLIRGIVKPEGGHWQAGDYRYEIWCGPRCLYAKSFRIH